LKLLAKALNWWYTGIASMFFVWRLAMGCAKDLEEGRAFLGVEFGSTRIKAVLVDENFELVASGAHDWQNRLENGVWTYSLDDVWKGLQESYKELSDQAYENFGVRLRKVAAIGISGMMHGYLAFGKDEKLLTPFRTWRNTTTGEAAEALSAAMDFNMPQRWSGAHLYQAILNKEEHVGQIEFLSTLAGYVFWKLTGVKAVGVGEASGMFPVDGEAMGYCGKRLGIFQEMAKEQGSSLDLLSVLPKVLPAGEKAGFLTEEGAKLLDPSGNLDPGALLCPPEGDAGTGMVATNCVAQRTCNVSAGTSVFAMAVLEKSLSKPYPEIDIVATPTGKPVAMVHCNNCASDLDAWVNLFAEQNKLFGLNVPKQEMYEKLWRESLKGDPAAGGLVSYNFFSGEPVVGLDKGFPLFARTPGADFSLPNFMRSLLFSSMASLKLGMDILSGEGVKLDRLLGHGGIFKTKGVASSLMAGALNVPVAVMENAGEGGAWGIALLAAYAALKKDDMTLEEFLNSQVFKNSKVSVSDPEPQVSQGFAKYMESFEKGLGMERAGEFLG
jgi:sugar (pentulose or hexulose) kinase